MIQRPGITLVEVLVAIFIMGVGMISLLTLFPLGALNIAQALKDDRAAQSATDATAYANGQDLRHDPNVSTAFANQIATQTAAGLSTIGPSAPIYVDPFYFSLGQTTLSNITRVTPKNYATTAAGMSAWFSLLDDLNFETSGLPTTQNPASPGAVQFKTTVERTGRYTWAYLLRRPRLNDPTVVEMSVVVYANRVTQSVDGESVLPGTGNLGDTTLTLSYTPATKPKIRNGSWILDTTKDATTKVAHGYFYRVVSATDNDGAGTYTLELQTPLRPVPAGGSIGAASNFTIVVMENVAEVFDRGAGYIP